MGRKLLNGCLVLLATFICPLSVIAAVGGGSLVFGASGEPSGVDIDVDSPTSVVVDEPFSIDVSVTNVADTMQTLDDIDLDAAALEVLEVMSTSPPFTRTSRNRFFKTYWFEEEIEPGATLKVSVEMVARETGTHPFWLDVCINVPNSCLNFEMEIVAR